MEAIFALLLPILGKLLCAVGTAAMAATVTPNPSGTKGKYINLLLSGINIVGANWGKAGNHQERE